MLPSLVYVASVSLSWYLYDLIEVCWLELFHLCIIQINRSVFNKSSTTGLRKEQVRQTVLQLFHCWSSELLRWHQFSRALALINTHHSQISVSWTPSQCTKTQKAIVFCFFSTEPEDVEQHVSAAIWARRKHGHQSCACFRLEPTSKPGVTDRAGVYNKSIVIIRSRM